MRRLNLIFISLFLPLICFISTNSSGSSRAENLAEPLLHMGPFEVGYTSITLTDTSRADRKINLMIWYPTSDDVSNKPLAVYQQVIPIPGLPVLPFVFDAGDMSQFVEGRLVYEGVAVDSGTHPLFVHLPGGASPGWLFPYEAVKFASHGFIFVAVTHPDGIVCQLDRDAKLVLDQLMAWNETEGNLFNHSIDTEAVFGGGHSFGGRTWLGRTSSESECNLAPEERMTGLALKDATREAISRIQLQRNFTDIFLNSQFCRNTQIALQQDLGSKAKMLTLEGVCPGPSGFNHTLFSQSCMVLFANVNAGNPPGAVFPPFTGILQRCLNPAPADLQRCPDLANYPEKEAFFAQQTTKFNLAYLKTLMGENQYKSILAPGQLREDGVFLIQTAVGTGGDETVVFDANRVDGAEGFCTQPGSDPGESPKVEFSITP